MSLAQGLLSWPQEVAQQVHAALFLPAADLHPQRARELVPKPLWTLSPARLSEALAMPAAWQEFDGRRLPHRLALLPRGVITRVAWNLGLLLSAAQLRRVVLRRELQLLEQQGLDASAWELVFKADKVAALADLGPLEQWAQAIAERGERSLLAVAQEMGGALGQRLNYKLAPDQSPAAAAAPELLNLAYTAAVQAWSDQWDSCLSQA